MNVDTLSLGGLELFCWDVGSTDRIRGLWRQYYRNSKALIFVVDSNDRVRMKEATYELENVLEEDELRNAVVLIYANKQDLPNAMSVNEVKEFLESKLDLNERKWHVEGCCSTNGEGLYEGMEWLLTTLDNKELLPDIKIRSDLGLNKLEELKKSITTDIINNKDKQGNTFLMLATSNNVPSKELLEYLLSLKADVNVINKKNRTPLFNLCSNYGVTEGLIDCLLSHKADPNIMNEELVFNELKKKTALHQICTSSSFNSKMLDLFIYHKADLSLIDGEGNTILHQLLRNFDLADISMVRKLLELKVDVNARNYKGETCLFKIRPFHKYYLNVLRLLIDIKIDLNIKENNHQNTVIHNCYKDFDDVRTIFMVKELLQGKADVNLLNKSNQSAVGLLLNNKPLVKKEVLESLVQHKADLHTKHQDINLLVMICKNCHASYDVIRFFLEYNLDPNLQDSNGEFAIQQYFSNSNSKEERALYMFLLYGANPFFKLPLNFRNGAFLDWLKHNLPSFFDLVAKFRVGKVGWSKECHHLFPSSIRRNIETLILCLKHFKYAHPPKPLVMMMVGLMVDLYYCEKLRNYENEANKKLK